MAGPEPVTSAPRNPRPTTVAFIVIGSSFVKVGSIVPTLSSSNALYLFTMRARAAGIVLVDDNALALCRLCARGARMRLETRVFGIRQVWRSNQQPRAGLPCPQVGVGAIEIELQLLMDSVVHHPLIAQLKERVGLRLIDGPAHVAPDRKTLPRAGPRQLAL